MKKIELESRPVSDHKDDELMVYVLCFLPENSSKYCVWLKRIDDGSYHQGFYTNDLQAALDNFKKRGA